MRNISVNIIRDDGKNKAMIAVGDPIAQDINEKPFDYQEMKITTEEAVLLMMKLNEFCRTL